MKMRIRTTVTAAVLLASLTASALPAAAAPELRSGNGAVPVCTQAAEPPAVLNSSRPDTEITYNADGTARTIFGSITQNKIRTPQDAASALKQVSALLGVTDFDSELRFHRCTEYGSSASYQFCQYYQGVRVESSFVSLVTENNMSDAVTSSFRTGLSLDPVPAVSAETARGLILKAYKTAADGEPELVIRRKNGADQLAWVTCIGNSFVYVDAQTGTVTAETELNGIQSGSAHSKSYTGNPVVGQNQTFTINYERAVFTAGQPVRNGLHDTKRNIWMYNGNDSFDVALERLYQNETHTQCFFTGGKYDLDFLGSNVITPDSMDDLSYRDTKLSIGVLYQVSRAYDYYNNKFHWTGTDNCGSALLVNGIANGETCAAACGNYLQFQRFNPEIEAFADRTESEACAMDCVIHEYTHRVTISKLNWVNTGEYGETASLSEAYSDIMGEYGDTETDWLVCRDWFKNRDKCLRDARNSNFALSAPVEHAEGEYKKGVRLYKYLTPEAMQSVEKHDGATIIDHCAYLMSQYGVPDDLGEQIWFRSMQYLPAGDNNANSAKFSDCRNAVVRAMRELGNQYFRDMSMTNVYSAKVMMAFNRVGIKDPDYHMGDINRDGRISYSDLRLLFSQLNGSTRLSDNMMALADVNYNGELDWNDYARIQNAYWNEDPESLENF